MKSDLREEIFVVRVNKSRGHMNESRGKDLVYVMRVNRNVQKRKVMYNILPMPLVELISIVN